MNRRQFLNASALFLAGALSACGGEPSQDLAQQFLTERNGGTPVAVGVGGPNAPVLGVIERIDGTQLTVKPPIESGTTTTVQLADGAKIRKQVDVQLADITAGISVTAFGKQQGDAFQADLLRLGDAAGADTAPMVFSSSDGASAAPPLDGQDQVIIGGPDGAQPQPIRGIVESVGGRSIVLKEQSGTSTTVTLTDGGKIQKLAEAAPAELTVGAFIMASGARNGAVLQATQVQILPAPQKVEIDTSSSHLQPQISSL
jgi:hypothetical protein